MTLLLLAGDEVITDAMVPEDPFTLHTIISVYMIANGLNSIEKCKSIQLSLSACLSLQKDARDLIYNGIINAQYSVLPNDLKDKSFNFKFTDSGYGDIGYNVLNFKKDAALGYIYKRVSYPHPILTNCKISHHSE